MTENRRIVLNIVATYCRALFAFACGVFGGRWALMSLGEVDYGLHGLVGGLTAFIGFLNGVLAAAVGRFYALSVGQSRKDPSAGLEEARRWFSLALLIHTSVPAILLAIGWPIGEWAIRSFLTIPPDRVNACLWVFRFCCIGCFVGMVSVPFNAFYGAKQYIAELTIYGFITTSLNIGVLYYMVTHPREWLVPYAAWLLVLGLVPSLIITGRAMKIFPECRFSFAYCRDWKRFRQLFAYAFWQLFGSLSVLMRGQGIAILVNKYFGPSFNASLAIARNVNGKANELGASLLGAFGPAITNAWGEGNFDRARKLALNVCKFSVLASFVFALPLMIELPYAMRLWLKTPPEWVTPLCCAVMTQIMINRTTKGHLVLIQATGRIGLYESVAAGLCLTMLPVAWLLIELGLGPWGLCISFVVVTAAYAWVRPFFASRLAGLSVQHWLKRVLFPLAVLAAVTLGVGLLCRAVLHEGFFRLCVTVFFCEAVLLPLAWAILFDAEERIFIRRKIFGERTARRIQGAYLAHAADPVLRAEGETGGTVTALLRYLLKTGRIDGAIVSRYNPATRACEAIYSESADEIASCAGSVYCQTPVVKVAREHADRRLAIVAVGCQARLLSRLRSEGKLHADTVVVGLVCSGTYRPEYVPAICTANGIDPSAVTGFRWKDKRFGKWPGNTMIKDSSGWHDFPGDARKRLKDEYRLPACFSCTDLLNENADFAVGDPWGMPDLPYEEKQKGTNVLIVRSCMGGKILSAAVAAGELTVRAIEPRRIFEGQKIPYHPGFFRRKFASGGTA